MTTQYRHEQYTEEKPLTTTQAERFCQRYDVKYVDHGVDWIIYRSIKQSKYRMVKVVRRLPDTGTMADTVQRQTGLKNKQLADYMNEKYGGGHRFVYNRETGILETHRDITGKE